MNGVNKLSGPGTEAHTVNGVLVGGEQWVRKVAEFCGEMIGEKQKGAIYSTNVVNANPTRIGEMGEDEIYAAFAKHTGGLAKFSVSLCTPEYCEEGAKEL